MKVLVLNGSPKGQKSVTLCSIKYLAKVYLADTFEVLDVARQIKAYERKDKVDEFKTAMQTADLVICAYPVYTFLATAQLHRFFEIMQENNLNFNDKYVTQITTSKHFYDTTAHGVVKKILMDFDGKYIGGLSQDMEDLTLKRGREQLEKWWEFVRFQAQNNLFESVKSQQRALPFYERKHTESVQKGNSKRVVIVTDCKQGSSLFNMIEDFCAILPYQTDVFNLNNFAFKCGCLGCLKCTQSGVCAINDGFEQTLNERINGADAILTAFDIVNHSMSSLFKTFFDRQFVNGHRPVTQGKPTGYIISGNFSDEDVLKVYVDAKSAVGGNYNLGIVCDEKDAENDMLSLAKRLEYALKNDIPDEHNFYEIGGMKIFRDMIWIMRGLMKADYDFYKKNGLLDFPQKKRGQMMLMKLLGKLLKNKTINKKMPNMMSDGMLMPYEKVIEKAQPKE